jgi:archaemetzincin
MTILILPILNISDKILADLKKELGNIFLSRVEIGERIDSLPEEIYDKEREQYDSSKFVDFLEDYAKHLNAEKIIAVANIDLFIGEMNFVFGVAQKGGRMCLISLYRLDKRFYGSPHDYDKLSERSVKEAVHELAHCYGLDHCRNDCVMAFSNNIMEVDQKPKTFCADCRERIRKAL